MTKLNWRDASKELPDRIGDDGLCEVCLVVRFYQNKPFLQKDWINMFTKKWTYSEDGQVKYWLYADEILPEE